MPEYCIAKSKDEFEAAAILFLEYASWLQVDLCFQSFDEELQTLDKMYASENGGIVLCKLGDEFIGCSAIRRIDTDICELKRMWVKPGHQNKGIGVGLLKECIQMAEKLKYKCIRLDTLERLAAAIHLYKKHGFVETAPYYFNPEKEVVYMEKEL